MGGGGRRLGGCVATIFTLIMYDCGEAMSGCRNMIIRLQNLFAYGHIRRMIISNLLLVLV